MTNAATAVNISDLSKAEVLAALFNASSPAGMGFLQAANGPKVMDTEYAQRLIDGGNTSAPDYAGMDSFMGRPKLYFDYLYGRPLKLDLTDDGAFDPRLYDRDNGGDGTAQRIIDRLRETHDVNPAESAEASDKLLQERREKFPNEAAIGDLLGLLAGRVQVVQQRLRDDGITVPSGLTARQHLDWASDTALGYYDKGEGDFTCDVFLELVSVHPGTAWIPDNPITPMMLALGLQAGRDRLEYMMKGFAA